MSSRSSYLVRSSFHVFCALICRSSGALGRDVGSTCGVGLGWASVVMASEMAKFPKKKKKKEVEIQAKTKIAAASLRKTGDRHMGVRVRAHSGFRSILPGERCYAGSYWLVLRFWARGGFVEQPQDLGTKQRAKPRRKEKPANAVPCTYTSLCVWV